MKTLTPLVLIAVLAIGCKTDKKALPPVTNIVQVQDTTTIQSDTLIMEYAFTPLVQPLTIYKYINNTLMDSVWMAIGSDHVYAGVIVQDGDSVCFKESGQPLIPYLVTDSDNLGYINPLGWYVNY
jgi:hypothetical protein